MCRAQNRIPHVANTALITARSPLLRPRVLLKSRMSEIDTSGSVRGVEVFRMVQSCDTPQIERAEQQGTQTEPKRETILRLLDRFTIWDL